MKAVSLWQPWASLIACGAKTVETRSWPAPRTVVGQRIAIHAAKRTSELTMTREPLFRDALRDHRDRVRLVGGELPLGFIVATAVLAECFRMDAARCADVRTTAPLEYAFGHWEPGRFGWRLTDVEVVEPIAYRGAQGVFDVVGVLGQAPAGDAQESLFETRGDG